MSEPIRDHCEDAYPELKMSCEDWVKRGAKHCPFCGADQCDGPIDYKSLDIDEGGAYQAASCGTCNASWVETYTLVGFMVTETPSK
jgi:hypothetical protein